MKFNIFGKKNDKPTKTAPAPAEAVEAVVAEASAAPSLSAVASRVLKSFRVSEKASRMLALNQYTFVVASDATKTAVRDAVEKGYKVKVAGVNIVRLPSKQRTVGRRSGSVPAVKKAVVTLREGFTIAAAQP
jgi:large subunit ribosomal protein L23